MTDFFMTVYINFFQPSSPLASTANTQALGCQEKDKAKTKKKTPRKLYYFWCLKIVVKTQGPHVIENFSKNVKLPLVFCAWTLTCGPLVFFSVMYEFLLFLLHLFGKPLFISDSFYIYELSIFLFHTNLKQTSALLKKSFLDHQFFCESVRENVSVYEISYSRLLFRKIVILKTEELPLLSLFPFNL